MTEYMDSGDGDPHDEARLVDREQQSTRARPYEQQGNSAREHDHRRGHDDRCDQTQGGRRRALAPVAGVRGVIANKTVAGAGHLQGDGRDQQYPEKHMLTQQWSDPEDRYAEGREEDQEDYPGRRGE